MIKIYLVCSIYIHDKYGGSKYGSTIKQKTIILLNEKGDCETFGMDAKITLIIFFLCVPPKISSLYDRYMGFPPTVASRYKLFENFKMALYGM